MASLIPSLNSCINRMQSGEKRFAYQFASSYLSPDAKDEDHVPLVEPEATGRHGPFPVVKTFNDYDTEAT